MNVRGKMYQVVISSVWCVYFENRRKTNWEFEEVMNSSSVQLDLLRKITVRLQQLHSLILLLKARECRPAQTLS
jgi:hypothetical protein